MLILRIFSDIRGRKKNLDIYFSLLFVWIWNMFMNININNYMYDFIIGFEYMILEEIDLGNI